MRYRDTEGAPSPPATLPEAWRETWQAIIESAGADHWRCSDGPALEALVTTLARLRWAQDQIARLGELGTDGERTEASRIAEQCAKIIGTLTPKLRLTPSSRVDARQAERSTRGSRAMDAHYEFLDTLREGEPWSKP